MSLSPVTTASAQRSIIASSSDDSSMAPPFPAHVLGYCGAGDAQSLCCIALAEALVVDKPEDHLRSHGREKDSYHAVVVHERAGTVLSYECRQGFRGDDGSVLVEICRASRKLNFSMMRWCSFKFFQGVSHGPRREPASLDQILVGHGTTGAQYLQNRP